MACEVVSIDQGPNGSVRADLWAGPKPSILQRSAAKSGFHKYKPEEGSVHPDYTRLEPFNH